MINKLKSMYLTNSNNDLHMKAYIGDYKCQENTEQQAERLRQILNREMGMKIKKKIKVSYRYGIMVEGLYITIDVDQECPRRMMSDQSKKEIENIMDESAKRIEEILKKEAAHGYSSSDSSSSSEE